MKMQNYVSGFYYYFKYNINLQTSIVILDQRVIYQCLKAIWSQSNLKPTVSRVGKV